MRKLDPKLYEYLIHLYNAGEQFTEFDKLTQTTLEQIIDKSLSGVGGFAEMRLMIDCDWHLRLRKKQLERTKKINQILK